MPVSICDVGDFVLPEISSFRAVEVVQERIRRRYLEALIRQAGLRLPERP